jgi:3-hydroxyacyl-[acyl-carrier-protein] dehydratase
MPPKALLDLSNIDLGRVQFDTAAIEAVNPHRGHMRLLDGVIYEAPDRKSAVAFKDVRPDEFWVPGHIPGRPLLPGVLMIEAAAQLASFVTLRQLPADEQHFMGFVEANAAKFRAQVVPGDRLLLMARETQVRRRRTVCEAQGWVGDNMVFEVSITGMLM